MSLPRFRAAPRNWASIWKACRLSIPQRRTIAKPTCRNSFACGSAAASRLQEAGTLINNRNVFGSMMVHMGDADALVSGVTQHFPDTIRPALQIVRMREGLHRVSGCYAVITRKGEVFFLADTSVNIEPTAEDLVEIALCTAHMARRFDLIPRVAMLSFSSFGGVDHPICTKVRKAVELIKFADPTLIVDGEIMADEALSPEIIEEHYPFSSLKGGANVLIFPDLASANIATQAGGQSRRRRTHRADPDGHEPPGARAAAFGDGGSGRQRGGHCRRGCAGKRYLRSSTCTCISRAGISRRRLII